MSPILLSREELKRKGIPYSTAQLYRNVKNGLFPAPIRLGGNRVAWLEHELDAWIQALAAAPRQRKPAPPRPVNGYRGGRPKKRPAQTATEAR
jgi:prophage regulatory protein